MLAFLQNSWVVGIGGGIVSGIIVYFITNWLYKRKDNSKYLEQISLANMDIIQDLKPYVAERGLPDKEIVDAIIVSTARKHKVKSNELYSIRIICEELIREIVENIYVSSEKKQEFSKQLQDYLHKLDSEKSTEFLISEIENEYKNLARFKETNYRRKTATMISTLLSIFTAMITLLFSLIEFVDKDLLNIHNVSNEYEMSIVIVLGTTVSIISLYLVIQFMDKLYKKLKDERKFQSEKEENQDHH